jgi:hypothetical protein
MKTYTASNWAACSAVSEAFIYCSIKTHTFYDLPLSAQSSCLCSNPVLEIDHFVSTVGFGFVASQCYQYLQASEPTYAPGFSSTLLNLCPVTGAATPAVCLITLECTSEALNDLADLLSLY